MNPICLRPVLTRFWLLVILTLTLFGSASAQIRYAATYSGYNPGGVAWSQIAGDDSVATTNRYGGVIVASTPGIPRALYSCVDTWSTTNAEGVSACTIRDTDGDTFDATLVWTLGQGGRQQCHNGTGKYAGMSCQLDVRPSGIPGSRWFTGTIEGTMSSPTFGDPAVITGAWVKIGEWGTDASGQVWRTENVQPSLYLFQDGYYSIAYVSGDEARPLFGTQADREALTSEEAASVWMPYISNSGTYEITPSSFTVRPMVALWPDYMAGGSRVYAYRVEEGMLHLSTQENGWSWNAVLRRAD